MDEYDVIIVGSGPAGLTAGIYAGRQGLKTLILEKGITGGLGLMVPNMENYPGFEKIPGKLLIEYTKKQTLKYAKVNEMEEVKKIEVISAMLFQFKHCATIFISKYLLQYPKKRPTIK